MDHAEVINRVRNLVPEIQQTRDPKSALLKLASKEDLSPAQLERVAQMFNTAKTLTFLDKSANRGGSFNLVDTEDLLDTYTAHKMPAAKAASIIVKQASETDPDDINAWIDGPQVKEASARFPRAEWELDKTADETLDEEDRVWRKEASDARRAADASQLVLDMIAEIRDQHQATVLSKIAVLKQAALTDAWPTLEEDAVSLLGDGVKPALDEFVGHMKQHGLKVARFEGPSQRKLAYDRTGYITTVAELADALDVVVKSRELEAMEKAAVKSEREHKGRGTPTLEGDPTPTPQGDARPQPGGGSKPPLPQKPPGKQQSGMHDFQMSRGSAPGDKTDVRSMVGGLKPVVDAVKGYKPGPAPWEQLLGIKTRDILNPGSNRRQQKIDEDVADDDSVMMLQRFMASDPVISEAEPDMVVDVFNAIRSINPEFANDPQRMRLALRDAIQYEALPIHSIKDLATLRVDTAKGESLAATSRKSQYATGGSKPGKGPKDDDA